MTEPTLASQFFEEREATLRDATSIKEAALRTDALLGPLVAKLLNRPELPGRPGDELTWFYRGQSDASWGISSSLYRLVLTKAKVTERRMADAEVKVLDIMRKQGLGHHMSDGQLLMVLQHHGIPTRLVDVSKGWLPALWFATGGSDRCDGRLFLIGIRTRANGEHPSIQLADKQDLPWKDAAIGPQYSDKLWSSSVMSVDDPSLDPRMQAQRGCFLVGGLTKRYGGESWPCKGEPLPSKEWPNISTLKIFFPQAGARKSAGTAWPAVAWTLKIKSELKPELRQLLAAHDYTHEHMYPDFDGSRRLGDYIARGSRT